MNEYVISCCSSADLSAEYMKKRNISYICMSYELDDVPYKDDLGQTMPLSDFYEAMNRGASTKTSQLNAEEYIEYFEDFLARGIDVIHLCLSSGITGTINSANIAKEELSEKYPDRKLYIVDSIAASSGYGLLMDKVADLRDEGRTIDELLEFVEEHKGNVNHWFFSTDLTHFIKGGRISKTEGFVGTMLSICPLMNVDFEGHLIPRSKIRTKKKAIIATAEKMFELADDGVDYAEKCFISNAYCYDDARALADILEEHFPKLKGKIVIFDIGTIIGAHTGPGTVALFFWGQKRVD